MSTKQERFLGTLQAGIGRQVRGAGSRSKHETALLVLLVQNRSVGFEVRMSQIGMAEKLGLDRKTVSRMLKRLQQKGLLVDLDAGMKNSVHTYRITLDWSFSRMLAAEFATLEPAPIAPLENVIMIRPEAEMPHPKKRTLGYAKTNGMAHECDACGIYVGAGEGTYSLFQVGRGQGQARTFCTKHSKTGELLARYRHDGNHESLRHLLDRPTVQAEGLVDLFRQQRRIDSRSEQLVHEVSCQCSSCNRLPGGPRAVDITAAL